MKAQFSKFLYVCKINKKETPGGWNTSDS